MRCSQCICHAVLYYLQFLVPVLPSRLPDMPKMPDTPCTSAFTAWEANENALQEWLLLAPWNPQGCSNADKQMDKEVTGGETSCHAKSRPLLPVHRLAVLGSLIIVKAPKGVFMVLQSVQISCGIL